MFSEISDMYVDIAQATEYRAAVEQHGYKFTSMKEAREILEEEVIEVHEEVIDMVQSMSAEDYDKTEAAARNCIKESAQVLAVLQKIKRSGL